MFGETVITETKCDISIIRKKPTSSCPFDSCYSVHYFLKTAFFFFLVSMALKRAVNCRQERQQQQYFLLEETLKIKEL